MNHSKGIFCQLFILIVFLFSCKKEKQELVDEVVSPTTGTRMEFTLDSIFLYAKQVYLWGDGLPGYADFDPRSRYGAINLEPTAYKTELYDISQMNTNPQTGSPYELPVYPGNPKYSYLEERSNPLHPVTDAYMASVENIPAEMVASHRIIEISDKKIAYLALLSFSTLADSKDELDQIFTEFAKVGTTELIVDLRANRGGYVETAEYVANLIVPSRLNAQVMYSEVFNSLLQNGKASILKNQVYRDVNGHTIMHNGRLATMADVDFSKEANTNYFKKEGKLESIQRVYFIVSGNTASASELLISSLKPYFDIKLIGEKTYGKPVGFFGIHIDRYTIYLSSFIIQNAAGWYDYFEGMQPDVEVLLSADAVLGNPEEAGLQATLLFIQTTDPITNALSKQSLRIDNQLKILKESQQNIQKASEGYIPLYKQRFKLK